MSEDPQISAFEWKPNRRKAVLALADGATQAEAAEAAEVTDRTIRTWLDHPDFAAEVDRLSLMTDIASRAERLRIAKRMVRKLGNTTGKDLLDWLKFAQSETDGIKLDLTALAAVAAPVADSGSD